MSYLIIPEDGTAELEVHLHQGLSTAVDVLGMKLLDPRFKILDHVFSHEIDGATSGLIRDGYNLPFSGFDVLEGSNFFIVVSVEDESVLCGFFGSLYRKGGGG